MADPDHHCGCCYANPKSREKGRGRNNNQVAKLKEEIVDQHSEIIKLTAELKAEKDRTDMFAQEVCDLIKDKEPLIAERDSLVLEADEFLLELGYCRAQCGKLEYRNLIKDAAPPQSEHHSTADRRVLVANNRVMVLWEQHKTMRLAIREYVDQRTISSYSL